MKSSQYQKITESATVLSTKASVFSCNLLSILPFCAFFVVVVLFGWLVFQNRVSLVIALAVPELTL